MARNENKASFTPAKYKGGSVPADLISIFFRPILFMIRFSSNTAIGLMWPYEKFCSWKHRNVPFLKKCNQDNQDAVFGVVIKTRPPGFTNR